MIVTGIGSRAVPKVVYDFISRLPFSTQDVIRSGAAAGCDSAFEEAALNSGAKTEIFLPWKNFNGHNSSLYLSNISDELVAVADEILKYVHPLYYSLGNGPKKLHTRNVFQVCGRYIQPNEKSDIVICWTPDGAYNLDTCSRKTGGTGTAIKIASVLDIPVYNLYNEKHLDQICDLFGI